jgi:putative transposase
MDNIFTERLWRTVKYENVFLRSYQNIQEAQAGLAEYFEFYNHRRRHSSLDYQTPAAVYFSQLAESPAPKLQAFQGLTAILTNP